MLVGEGMVTGVDSVLVGIGTGTTAVVDSSEDVVELALSVPLVIADSAESDLVDDAEDSEAPVVEEASEVVDAASEAPEVVVDASVAPEVVVAASEAPEVVVDASEAPDVAEALESVEVAVTLPVGGDSAPDVASPDPVVLVKLSSPEVVIGTGTMGTIVLLLLVSVAVSVELLEEPLDGLSVGASVDCSTAVADTLAVDDASVAVELVVTGTGMAVVPLVPVDVLRL